MTAPTAAITGGTGFLGRAICAALLESGWQLRLLVRPATPVPDTPPVYRPIAAIRGDLSDAVALRQLVQGADAVVHCAGAVKALNRADFFTANEAGTANLAAAIAAEGPAARIVHISSMAARVPQLSAYAASKAAGEAALLAAHPGATVLRPGPIYGPGDMELLRLFKAVRAPILPLPHGAEARVCMIHVRDAASAAAAALNAPSPAPGTFELVDAEAAGYPWAMVAGLAALSQQRAPPRILRLPRWLLAATGHASGTWAQLRRRPTVLTRDKVDELLHPDWTSTEAHRPPSWHPAIDLTAGFAETVAWYRAQGLLRR